MGALTVASGTNTFVPNAKATKGMTVDVSRNPKEFAINQYMQYQTVDQVVGLYPEMSLDEPARVEFDDGRDALWEDGQDAPEHRDKDPLWQWKAYHAKRYNEGFRIGGLAAEQAEWDIVAQYARMVVSKVMTRRTMIGLKPLVNTANYTFSNTDLVENIGGASGKWDVSTVARSDIKRTLDFGARRIQLLTNSAVRPKDLIVVMNPNVAAKISISNEIRDFIKQSPLAKQGVESNLGDLNRYGLPEYLYDYKVVVEDAVRVTSNRFAARAEEFVLPDNRVLMLSRIGGLHAPAGPSFSTATIFFKEEMTVEDWYDKNNRVHKGRVVEHFAAQLTAPFACYLFQSPLT